MSLTLVIFLLCPFASAQWMQTNGPLGGIAAVNCMAASGAILLAGVEGGGVYASADRGANWKRTNIGLTTTSVHTLVVDGAKVFAGTDSGVFVSTNNGAAWTQTGLMVGPVNALALRGFELFAGTGDGIFCSTDNGDNWTAAVDSGLTYKEVHALATTGTNLVAATTYTGGVFVSPNDGASWTWDTTGLGSTIVNNFAVSGTTLFAGTFGSGVSFSTDNGTTWKQSGLTNGSVAAFSVVGTKLFAGCDGDGVFVSDNGGAGWTDINDGLMNMSVYALAASDANIIVATASGIFTRNSKGSSWTKISVIGNPNVHVTAFAAKGSELFAGASWGVTKGLPKLSAGTALNSGGLPLSGCLYHSTDNGDTWVPLLEKFVCCFAISGNDIFAGARGLIDDWGGIVYHTTDNGLTWSRDSIGTIGTVEALVTSPNGTGGPSLFAGTSGGGVFLSTDDGESWGAVNNGIPKSPNMSNLYAKVSAFTVSGPYLFAATECGLFRSTNSGTSWTAANDGLTDTLVYSLAISGTILFAGTGTGVFLSTNSGTTWAAVTNGLPIGATVGYLAVSGTNLFASISPDGVFLSTNNGTTWRSIASGLPSISSGWRYDRVGPLALTPDYAFVGTGHSGGYSSYGSVGSGVWRRPLSEVVNVGPRPSELPTVFNLSQNYPNPFNPITVIKYTIGGNRGRGLVVSDVKLVVYDVLGREVAVLVNERRAPGNYEARFDASGFSSGVYFYRLTDGNLIQTRKMTVVR